MPYHILYYMSRNIHAVNKITEGMACEVECYPPVLSEIMLSVIFGNCLIEITGHHVEIISEPVLSLRCRITHRRVKARKQIVIVFFTSHQLSYKTFDSDSGRHYDNRSSCLFTSSR